MSEGEGEDRLTAEELAVPRLSPAGPVDLLVGSAAPSAHERAAALLGRTLLDRYRLEELIAMGGIASVFRATRLSDGQAMAIKLLHPEAEDLPELIERFEREAIAGKHIFHPNVVTVHEIARLDDGSFFLVQDFVRGITLRDLIDRGPVEPLRAARIARQIAAGLTAAHDMGIVHRDIKPRNVMLVTTDAAGAEDAVQIVDFGLAKVPVESLSLLDDDSRRSLTGSGVVFGTVAYMAPEAAYGMRSIDRRSDLYALGVMLYEMLAGRHPFTAADTAEMFKHQRHTMPPPIHERSPGVVVPAAIDDVMRRLLAKDPEARYQQARALIVALDGAIQSMDAARRATPAPRGVKVGRIVIALAIALVVAGAAWLATHGS